VKDVGPRLNRRLILETIDRVSNGSGGYVETWTQLGQLWGRIETRVGRTTGDDDAELAIVTARITVRAAGPDSPRRPRPGQVLREGSRRFLVDAVSEADPTGMYLTCFAREEEVSK